MDGSTTFQHQTTLPKLPIPQLEDTCAKYLRTIEPLVTATAFEQTKTHVENFLRNEGPALQAQLTQFAEQENSYIERFWDESYLNYRGSLVTHVNPIFVLEDDPTPSRNNQMARASSLILSSLKFVQALRQGTLTPDVVKGTPLCMSQFTKLFGCARVPDGDSDKDVIKCAPNSRHVVVVSRGQIYYFDALNESSTVAITEREITNNLTTIKEDSITCSDADVIGQAVTVLTAEVRPTWAKIRKHLTSLSPNNARSLEVIDEALFVVCLDDVKPTSVSDTAANILHGSYAIKDGWQVGSCLSRWYDKLQIIVSHNGSAGINFEHSAVDGHTVLRFASDVFTDTIIRFAQAVSGIRVNNFIEHSSDKSAASTVNRPDLMPRKIDFDVDEKVKRAIRFAEASLSDIIVQNETCVLEYSGYGKLYIVQNRLSPDAFIQVAIMLAYYQLYGHVPNTYESVQTKSFLHGRTEAGRCASQNVLKFCKAFTKDKAMTDGDKITLLREAAKAHSVMTREASKGLGVDRHLYALCNIQKLFFPDQKQAKLFKDPSWATLQESVISTSNCGNPSLRFFGFGPVTNRGFGIGYIIKDQSIHFCITSKHRQTHRYLTYLESYLNQIQDILIAEANAMLPNTSTAPRFAHQGYGFFDDGETMEVEKVGRKLEWTRPSTH